MLEQHLGRRYGYSMAKNINFSLSLNNFSRGEFCRISGWILFRPEAIQWRRCCDPSLRRFDTIP